MGLRSGFFAVWSFTCAGIQVREGPEPLVPGSKTGIPMFGGLGFQTPFAASVFNKMIEEGMRHANDPKNYEFVSKHASTAPDDATHGFFISYVTESHDGSKWSLNYDHGCEPGEHANKCFFRLGETVASDGVLRLAHDVTDDATVEVATTFNLYGILKKVFGNIVHSPMSGICPACGAECDREQLPPQLKAMVANIQIPVTPCPIPKGELVFDRNVTDIPDDFGARSIHFDTTGSETLRKGNGKIIFRTTVSIAMGPMSMNKSSGTGGSWILHRPETQDFEPAAGVNELKPPPGVAEFDQGV